MLARNATFNTKKVEKRKSDLTPFIESLKIQVEKLDFEGLNSLDEKIDLLKALDNKNFAKVNDIFAKLVKIAEELESEDFKEIKDLSIKAEQMLRLSKI